MTGRVISFPGGVGQGGDETPPEVTADEILTAAVGKYENVLIIGLTPTKAQCITTISLEQSVYELSRAMYKLHGYIEGR